MKNKTRKHIWPGALVATIAIMGVLAAIVVLTTNLGPTSAHGGVDDHDAECAAMTPEERDRHDARARALGDEECPDPDGTTGGNGGGGNGGNGGGGNGGNGGGGTGGNGGGGTAIAVDVEAPGAVRNLTVVTNENGTPQEELLISWQAPDSVDSGPVTSYRIDISEDGERWLAHLTDHGDSDLRLVHPSDDNPGLDADGLVAETTRHFRVFAFYDKNADERIFGPGSDASGTTAASWAPDAPTNLVATDDASSGSTPTTVKLTWNAPDDPPGAPVTGFDIGVSSDGINYQGLHETGDVMTFTHGDLLADTQRWYRVRAKNSVGESGWSDGDTGMTSSSVAPGTISEPVIGLAPEATDVYLTWTPPDDPDGDPVTHYRIQARHSATTPGGWRSLSDSKHISKRDSYHFTGADLATGDIVVPQSIEAGKEELVQVDIRIGAINRKNTDTADGFAGNRDIDVEWTTFMNVPVGHQDAPLDPSDQGSDGAPMVKVDTSRHQGRSGLNVTWPTAEFTKDNGPTPAVQRYMIGSAEHYTDAVTYVLFIDDEEQSPIPHSNAVRADANDFAASTAAAMGGDRTKPGYDQDGLATETEKRYSYQVVYQDVDALVPNASVRSLPSNEGEGVTEQPTKPGTPESFRVTSDGHTEIKLSWEAPSIAPTPASECAGTPGDGVNDGSECGESVITSYEIERSATGEIPWELVKTVGAADTDYVDTGRDPGARYYYRVSTVNSRYTSTPTEARSAMTHRASNPTPPGGLVAQADGSNAIKLCWYEQNTGDPSVMLSEDLPILGYMITYVGADGEMVLRNNTSSNRTQYKDAHVPPATTRTYRVRALTLGNIEKTGDDLLATKYVEATAMTAGTPPPAVLTAPTNVTATADGNSVTIMWGAADNADRYIAVLFDSNWEFDTDHVATHQTDGSVTFDNVPAGTYTAAVISIMDDASGNATDLDFAIDSVTVN